MVRKETPSTWQNRLRGILYRRLKDNVVRKRGLFFVLGMLKKHQRYLQMLSPIFSCNSRFFHTGLTTLKRHTATVARSNLYDAML